MGSKMLPVIIRSFLLLFSIPSAINIESVECAKIFCYFTTPSISHQAVFQPIWRELSLRGHQVAVVTPNPLKDPTLINLTEIDINYSYELFNLHNFNSQNENDLPDATFAQYATMVMDPVFDSQMNHSAIKTLLKECEKQKFDLVLVEMMWPPSYGFASKFNCPLVGMVSLPDVYTSFAATGNPSHPILTPDVSLGYGNKLNFWQRLESTYIKFRLHLRYYYEIMPTMDKIARKYFGNDLPYLGDIEKNVSIVLTAYNFLISKPKPTVPTLIEIGNVHIRKNTKLPEDLQKELDEETRGVIYFSLGSNVKSVSISSQLRNTIISAFSELPYKILWKWETYYLPNKPDNVIIRKWLPQEAVLAHPNVKVFITQCGLQSMEEAIYYRKPMVGMPFFGDQNKNVKGMAESGIGVEIDFHTVTKSQLKSAILEVFHNKTYRERISKLADIIWDQPMSGLDTAIWWIEYVIRHKGAKHLRSPLLDIPWYQYLLLDVIAFVLAVFLLVLGLFYFISKFLMKLMIRVENRKIKTF